MSATAACRCRERGLPKGLPRVYPECDHVFKGSGWDGVDAHWRSKHEGVMTYELFWASLRLAPGGLRP